MHVLVDYPQLTNTCVDYLPLANQRMCQLPALG
jgi:hypothetical protein